MTDYMVELEVAGPAAMFARPDTGATPISYPVPTWSAAKGMFDAVVWRPHVYIHPIQVEICRPVRYERYVTNYGGPLRGKEKGSFQLHATILVDVCYRIYADVRMKTTSTRGNGRAQSRRRRGQDWRPHLKAIFDEWLSSGRNLHTPCLGWKEFVPTYFGPFRDRDEQGHVIARDRSINLDIPSLLHSMWEHRKLKPKFVQDWHVVNGVMSYERRRPLEGSDVD
jgi:CRISPR-associated protein Cas5d